MKTIVKFQILVFTFFSILNVVMLKKIRYNTIPQDFVVNKPFTPEVISKTCLLKPDQGPCRSNVGMYYFDPRHGSCNFTFSWGGCQGNGNRFDTIRECEDKCLSKNTTTVVRPRYCFLSFDYGFCFGASTRYYYNHIWKTCRETIYSGCGGNKNNFYSLEQCESICRFGRGPLEEEAKPQKGAIKKVLIINPPNTTEKPVKVRAQDQGQVPETGPTGPPVTVTRAYNNNGGIGQVGQGAGQFKRK